MALGLMSVWAGRYTHSKYSSLVRRCPCTSARRWACDPWRRGDHLTRVRYNDNNYYDCSEIIITAAVQLFHLYILWYTWRTGIYIDGIGKMSYRVHIDARFTFHTKMLPHLILKVYLLNIFITSSIFSLHQDYYCHWWWHCSSGVATVGPGRA